MPTSIFVNANVYMSWQRVADDHCCLIGVCGLSLSVYCCLCVAASKERMTQHKECFGAKSFESVALERFVQ